VSVLFYIFFGNAEACCHVSDLAHLDASGDFNISLHLVFGMFFKTDAKLAKKSYFCIDYA
jgi:hypothetical protein